MASPSASNELLKRIDATTAEHQGAPTALDPALKVILEAFGCVVGTIHFVDPATGSLKLYAQRGIPSDMMDRIRQIPFGKGMAGLAAERREAVQVCNLQSDDSGQAKPGARQTQMEGSISLPMMVNGEVRGVLGVAKPEVYEYSQEEIDQLMEVGHRLAVSVRLE